MLRKESAKNIIIIIGTCLLGLLLFANFYNNIFEILPETYVKDWLWECDIMITNRIAEVKANGLLYNFGFLSNIFGGLYLRQLGLAGNFYALLNLIFRNIEILRAINVLFLCTVFIYLLNWIRKEFGTVVAIFSYLIVLFSPWLILTARSLYWELFLLILPFAVSIYFLNKEDEGNKISIHWWGFWLAFTVFLKSGCGYEFITTTVVNAIAPIFYYAYKNKWGWKLFFRRLLIIGLYAVFGFILSFALWSLLVYFYLGCKFQETLYMIISPIAYRTGVGFDALFHNVDFTDISSIFVERGPNATRLDLLKAKLLDLHLLTPASITATKLEVLKTYIYGYYTTALSVYVPNGEKINIFILWGQKMIQLLTCFGIFGFIQGLSMKFKAFDEQTDRKSIGLLILTLILLTGPMSWYILASPHAYIHTYIDYSLWALPATTFIGASTGYIVWNLLLVVYNKFNKKVDYEND